MFKRSILLPVVAMLGLLLTAFLAAYHWEHRQTDRRTMGQLTDTARSLFENNVRAEASLMRSLLTATARDARLAEAMVAGDRTALAAEALPFFNRLHRDRSVTHLYFIQPDGRVFLRAHRPELFGDRIQRRTLEAAMATDATVSGIERGALGILSLRAVMPWRVKDRLIGYLEFGQDVSYVLTHIKRGLHTDLVLMPLQEQADADERPIMAATLDDAERLPLGELGSDSAGEFEFQGRELHAATTTVADADGKPFGELLVLEDVTARHQTIEQTMLVSALAGLAVTAALILFFSRLVGRVEQQVGIAQSNLEAQVQQRTAELVREVEERRLAEERLTLLYRAVEQSPASVMVTDYEGRIEYVNPRFTEVSGYSAAEVVGRNPSFLKSGEVPPETYHEMWELLRTGNEWHGEFLNRRKDGTRYCEAASVSPVRAPSGEIRHFIAVKEDITERKQAEARHAALHADLAHMDRLSLLGEMAATLAHEVKQPLATIVNFAGGCIQRLRNDRAEPEAMLFALEKIRDHGKLAGEIIRKVREFAGKAAREPVPVAINQLVFESLDLLDSEARRAEVPVQLELGRRLPSVMADPIQIQQVLTNLFLNAIQAMKPVPAERRRLDVVTEKAADGMVAVTVTDRGPGAEISEIEKMFEPFYTTKPAGMGMGLAICRSIVEGHGGHIEVRRDGGGGLAFQVTLPGLGEGGRDAA